MRRWAALAMVAGLVAAGCSSSSDSQGVVSTSAAPTSAASEPGTTAAGTDDSTTTTASAGPVSLVVGVDTDPPSLDPAGNTSSFTAGSVLLAVFDVLMLPSEQGGPPEPMLLESLTEAPDRLSWELKLRPGLTFSDGTPLDAEAVKFNLDRQKVSIYNSPALEPVTAIEVIDPLTVVLRLQKPWVAMPSALSGVVGLMASPTAVQERGEQFGRNPVGAGAFVFEEWAPNDHITVKKNPSYQGRDPAVVDEIEFRFISEENARVAALKAGDIDAMTGIVQDNIDALAGDSAFQVVDPPTQGYGLAWINTTKPGLDDARVRRALDLAVDRDAIAEAFDGDSYAETGWGPFPRDNPWFLEPDPPPSFDPDEARRLLAEYGQPVSLTYKSFATPQSVVDQIKATIDYWKAVGIDAQLEIVPDATQLVTDVVLGNFDMASWANGTGLEPDTVLYPFFHSAGSRNFSKFSNAEVDAALEAGRSEADPVKRKEHYDTVQRLLREQMPVLFSQFGSIFVAGRAELTGIDAPVAFFPSRTVGVAG